MKEELLLRALLVVEIAHRKAGPANANLALLNTMFDFIVQQDDLEARD